MLLSFIIAVASIALTYFAFQDDDANDKTRYVMSFLTGLNVGVFIGRVIMRFAP